MNQSSATLSEAEVQRIIEAAARSSKALRRWAPECFPTDANGQVHFARALMESVADDLDGVEPSMKETI